MPNPVRRLVLDLDSAGEAECFKTLDINCLFHFFEQSSKTLRLLRKK